MTSPRKPWWQQATALVSLGAGGAITGFAFAPGTADQVASPTGIPVMLTALDHAAQPAPSDDAAVRSAIVSVASYYQRVAQSKTPAEMEALIWQRDSKDGADHGESCAAFASMTLALAAQMVGRQSWVTGGSTYPWPLQDWADVRVDPNPASLGITSIVQDAQAHQRWHPLGDGYQPLPGDWVLFPGHVEVVTKYAGGVLSTVGGDSLPNFSVNAHDYPGPLSAQGVTGFVSNGNLPVAATAAASTPAPAPAGASTPAATQGASAATATQQADKQPAGALAAVPGTATMAADTAAGPADGANIPGVPQAAQAGGGGATARHRAAARPAPSQEPSAARPTAQRSTARQAATHRPARQNAGRHASGPDVAIPGMPDPASAEAGSAIPSATDSGHQPAPASAAPSSAASPSSRPSATASPSTSVPASASAPGTAAEQAFINQVAAGAIAAQTTYGVPASVTIAQAIDESAWGQSTLAAQDHNLFGIKGTGPAGSISFPTQEFQNGQWVTISAQFRAYHDVTQSIDDHGKLLATSGYYTAAMAASKAPDQFAQALTGVYATNPSYGSNLISLMQRYDLYRFDAGSQSAASSAATGRRATASAQPRASRSAAQAGSGAPSAKVSAPATAPATRASAAPGPRASSAAVTPTAIATAPSVTTPQATSAPAATPHATATPQAAPPVAATPHVVPIPVGTPTTAVSPLPTSHATAPAAPVRGPASPVSARASRPAAQPSTGPVPHPFATPQTATPQSPAPQVPAPQAAAPQTAAPQTAAPQGAVPQTGAPHATAPSAAATSPDQAAIPGILSTPAAASTHTSAALQSSTGTARPRSSSDTQVVAELAAVFRPTAPAGNPAPVTQTASHSGPRSSAAAGTSAAKRTQPGKSPAQKKPAKRKSAAAKARKAAPRYQPQMPTPVKNAFLATARSPLARAELMYRDVAGTCGISWKLLAACDWMQCEAHPRYSPVNGEKLGTVNTDGTVFRTKSEALTQCANDLIDLAGTVYQIDLTVPVELSVLELARVFAAFRWGGLLRLHNTSAMEFPYSVQGLTEQHTSMRWPRIAEPNTPDKRGARFRRPFGAVPVVLSLEYPATV